MSTSVNIDKLDTIVPKKDMKYIFVMGGSMSGLGKGTAVSSLGVLLKSFGYRVTAIKIDPYLNIDAGTMSPYEHGEVYVMNDGGETDLDLGNYERFLDVNLSSKHNITSGKIYSKIIEKERRGDYLGKTVQTVPHVTDTIQEWIESVSHEPVDGKEGSADICLVELGGTVGDIESAAYLEAIQQFKSRVGSNNINIILVGMVPVIGSMGEQKTKPVQHAVKQLREAGIQPDFVFCRLPDPLVESSRKKISLFCQVPQSSVVSMHDATNIYKVPLLFHEQEVGQNVLKNLGLSLSCSYLKADVNKGLLMAPNNLNDWKIMADRVDRLELTVSIAVVGKYTGLQDSYLSVLKAIRHACTECGRSPEIVWIESSDLEPTMRYTEPEEYDKAWSNLKACNGVLVPGGFGDRGVEGKVLCAKYCREAKVPYLGICLGLQTAVMSFARDVAGMEGANSTEFDRETKNPVVIFMPEISTEIKGGTMRLGSRVTQILDPNSLACKLYGGKRVVHERHRHRYEVNPDVAPKLEALGMKFSGRDTEGKRMEIVEIPSHPFFVATQYHPEYQSRPMCPSPPFLGFVLASSGENILESRIERDGGVLKVSAGWKSEDGLQEKFGFMSPAHKTENVHHFA